MNKVLICDDDLFVLKMIGTYLKKEGFEVVEAQDGKQGLEQAQKVKIDVAILDVNMPDMTGLELCAALRKIKGYEKIPIVIATTESKGPMVTKGKRAGATAWMVKPLTGSSVKDVIEKTIQPHLDSLEEAAEED